MSSAGVASNQAELLLNAFHSFNEVSGALQTAYQDLQDRVHNLSEELEQRNYFLSTVLQSLPCGVLVVNPGGDVTTLNRAARELFEIPEIETPFALASILEGAAFSDRADMLMEEGGSSTEITLIGAEERTLHCSWAALRDGERVLVVQDLSPVRRLEKQMREAERLAAMGEMALEVAHEIRNPLGALELFASLLEEEDLATEVRAGYLANIRIGIRSLNTVLNNMLCIRRTPEPKLGWTRLGEAVGSTAEFMRPLLEQRGIPLEVLTRGRNAASARRAVDPASRDESPHECGPGPSGGGIGLGQNDRNARACDRRNCRHRCRDSSQVPATHLRFRVFDVEGGLRTGSGHRPPSR